MCMGPKCPCIYPQMPHKEMKYVTFRERSPIDRVLIKNKLNEISKTLLKKLKYTARPPSSLQYQIFALGNLLGEESDSWFRVQQLFSDPEALKNKITQLDVNKLTIKQIEKSQHWLDEYSKLAKDNVVTIFADAAKGILSKIVEVEQEKHKELIKDFKEVCIYDTEEEAAVLSITQETLNDCPQKIDQSSDNTEEQTKFESPQRTLKNMSDFCPPNSSTTLFCKFLDRTVQKSPLHMSFCRSPDKSFRDSRRTPTKGSDNPVKFDDIVSLKKELELIQRDITRLEGVNKKKEFLLNRSALRLKTEEIQQAKIVEFSKVREKTQKDESVDEKQKKQDISISRDHSAFRKQLNSKSSPKNPQFLQYLEKYTSKYIPILDRITSQQQELRSIKSQLQIASSIKKLKEHN